MDPHASLQTTGSKVDSKSHPHFNLRASQLDRWMPFKAVYKLEIVHPAAEAFSSQNSHRPGHCPGCPGFWQGNSGAKRGVHVAQGGQLQPRCLRAAFCSSQLVLEIPRCWKWQGCGSEMFSGVLTEVEKSQERGKKKSF